MRRRRQQQLVQNPGAQVSNIQRRHPVGLDQDRGRVAHRRVDEERGDPERTAGHAFAIVELIDAGHAQTAVDSQIQLNALSLRVELDTGAVNLRRGSADARAHQDGCFG